MPCSLAKTARFRSALQLYGSMHLPATAHSTWHSTDFNSIASTCRKLFADVPKQAGVVTRKRAKCDECFRCDDALECGHALRHEIVELLVLFHADDRDEIVGSGHRVDVDDSLDRQQFAGDCLQARALDGHEDESGYGLAWHVRCFGLSPRRDLRRFGGRLLGQMADMKAAIVQHRGDRGSLHDAPIPQ